MWTHGSTHEAQFASQSMPCRPLPRQRGLKHSVFQIKKKKTITIKTNDPVVIAPDVKSSAHCNCVPTPRESEETISNQQQP